jgi:hypothetical protein
MSEHPTDSSSPITIFYEVLPEDPQEADPAEMQAVATSVVASLRKEGYQVDSVPTGTLGADLLYQIVPFVQAAVQTAITRKDEITGAINTIKPIAEQIMGWYNQRQADKVAKSAQGAIEFEVRLGPDYDTFNFKSSGSEGTEKFDHAFEQFLAHSQHTKPQAQLPPANQTTIESTLTIRERVPARRRRKRH